jgi:formate dehydrogenase subunit gamma
MLLVAQPLLRDDAMTSMQEPQGRTAMTPFLTRFRVAACALVLLTIAASTVSAGAQQPTQVNPTASSVTEEQLFKQLRIIDGRCTLPDQKACTLEQPAGRDWRYFHQVTLPWIGAIAIIGIFALLLLFYLFRGTIRIEAGRSGRTLLRFNAFERFVHWMTAVCFIVLAISGLNITFGRQFLLPMIGPETFTLWSQWAKYAHNYLSFPFTLGVVLTFLMWLSSNFPTKADVEWMKKGGGMIGHEHPAAGRFNPGQKFIYWMVVVGGAAVAITGYILMFPFYGTSIAGMQTAQIIHALVGVLFIAGMLVHIYMGTLGEEGAFESMTNGTVDENWAKQHHSIWHEREVAKGNIATPLPQGKVQPAE